MASRRNISLAIKTLRGSRWRSLMTMTGIIVGIVAVITTVSLGEGVKHQVVGQINHLGSDLITVRPGNSITRDSQGNITHVTLSTSSSFGNGSLSSSDLDVIQKTPGVKQAVPISLVNSGAKNDQQQYTAGIVIGTGDAFADVINQKIAYGSFFGKDDGDKQVAIIGKTVAEQLFHENVPVGMSFSIKGQEFIVRGVFEEFNSSPIALGPDFNKAIVIPYQTAQKISGGSNQLVQILVRPNNPNQTKEVIAGLNETLRKAHGNQDDFTVLRQDENLTVTSDILNIFTAFIAGIAAMTLLVGGIGIMNIMLASVSERTREIGIRKAVGATNRQILSQFLTEATVLSVSGGVIGLALAFLINYLLKVLTNLEPVITLPVALIAVGISVAIGIVFGITPAVRASHKDPIDALRYE